MNDSRRAPTKWRSEEGKMGKLTSSSFVRSSRSSASSSKADSLLATSAWMLSSRLSAAMRGATEIKRRADKEQKEESFYVTVQS